jgi:hypothetical protein
LRPKKSVAHRGGHLLHSDGSRSIKEQEMRRAFMSILQGTVTHTKDMTLDANLELGDFGACRRR